MTHLECGTNRLLPAALGLKLVFEIAAEHI